MSGYRPIDSKREEFRKYLERGGALDALTKVLVMLYEEPEKPADPLEYVRKHLGEKEGDTTELNALKTELESANMQNKILQDEIAALKEHIAKLEPAEDVGPPSADDQPAPESSANQEPESTT